MTKDIYIAEITENNLKTTKQINYLLNILNADYEDVSFNKINSLINKKNIIILGAFYDSNLVGILSLICVDMLVQKKGLIEDVVVDPSFRGKKIGKKLMVKAHELAKQLNCTTIHLTSRPSRVEANYLYKSLGYKTKKTNYYILSDL